MTPTENELGAAKRSRGREIPSARQIPGLVGEARSGELSRGPIGDGREVRVERKGGPRETKTSHRRKRQLGGNLIEVIAFEKLMHEPLVPKSVATNTATVAALGLSREPIHSRGDDARRERLYLRECCFCHAT